MNSSETMLAVNNAFSVIESATVRVKNFFVWFESFAVNLFRNESGSRRPH